MRLLINIPKEVEQHFKADRFEDSLHRLATDAHLIAGNYEQETAIMLIEAFKQAIPAADMVEVVRCQECFYCSEMGPIHFCDRWVRPCPDDSEFYCKWGKRKDGGQDE